MSLEYYEDVSLEEMKKGSPPRRLLPPLPTYFRMIDDLRAVKSLHGRGSKEETKLLGEMNLMWKKLSDEERECVVNGGQGWK